MKYTLFFGACLLLACCGASDTSQKSAAAIAKPKVKPIVRIQRGDGPMLDFSNIIDPNTGQGMILLTVMEEAYPQALAEDIGLLKGENMYTVQKKVGAYMGKPLIGTGVEHMDEWDYERNILRVQTDDGGTIIMAMQEGLTDAYLEGEQILLIFSKNPQGGYSLDRYGRAVKCKKGENTRKYQTMPCPH